MKQRVLRFLKILVYPAFYLFCLVIFGYLTFPYARLKDRAIAELEKRGKPGLRIEIGKLGSYWLSGVEVAGLKIHLPPDEPRHPNLPGLADPSASSSPSKETVIVVDEAHARVRLLPLLIGRVRVDFWASAFGGEIKGLVPFGKGEVELALDHLDLSRMDMLAAAKIPVKGMISGKLALEAPEGKFNKANGTLDLTIADLVVSDGTTKIRDLITLPPAKLGELTIKAEAKDGVLKINQLSAGGSDLEIAGEGRLSLREPWTEATADLYARFRFTDSYRGKNELTKGLLGAPGSKVTGSIDFVPEMKAAKRPDGFYGWKISGALKKLRFDPYVLDAPVGPSAGAGAAASPPPAARRPIGKGFDGPRRPPIPTEGLAAPGREGPPPGEEGHPAARNPALPIVPPPMAAPPPPPPVTAPPAPPPPPPPAQPEPAPAQPQEGAPPQ